MLAIIVFTIVALGITWVVNNFQKDYWHIMSYPSKVVSYIIFAIPWCAVFMVTFNYVL